MLAPVMTMREGARSTRPTARCSGRRTARQPGLVAALEALAREGGQRLPGIPRRGVPRAEGGAGGVIDARTTSRVTRHAGASPSRSASGHRVLDASVASRCWRNCSSAFPARAGGERNRAGARARSRRSARLKMRPGHTTNIAVVDADGNACVVTIEPWSRFGRLRPRLRPSPEQHARREGSVHRHAGARRPDGEHDGAIRRASTDGLALAIGSAGGTRLRTALAPVVGRAYSMSGSSRRRRSTGHEFIRRDTLLNAEPGVDEKRAGPAGGRRPRDAAAGAELHHYFGGVSARSRGWGAGDRATRRTASRGLARGAV